MTYLETIQAFTQDLKTYTAEELRSLDAGINHPTLDGLIDDANDEAHDEMLAYLPEVVADKLDGARKLAKHHRDDIALRNYRRECGRVSLQVTLEMGRGETK